MDSQSTTSPQRAPWVRIRHQEVAPSGCRWCGNEKRGHGIAYVLSVGMHVFTEPTAAQRLARVKARRTARLRRG